MKLSFSTNLSRYSLPYQLTLFFNISFEGTVNFRLLNEKLKNFLHLHSSNNFFKINHLLNYNCNIQNFHAIYGILGLRRWQYFPWLNSIHNFKKISVCGAKEKYILSFVLSWKYSHKFYAFSCSHFYKIFYFPYYKSRIIIPYFIQGKELESKVCCY
jgi:hypothetical protein